MVIGYSLMLLLFGLGYRLPANVLQATWWKCRKTLVFCMTILNCWYGITKNWQISWGISFHTNASTSVAVTNGTSFSFLRTCSYLMLHYIKIPKFVSLRLGMTFQNENPLSCRRVWKFDLWNIYKNKISQDFNKHTIKTKKVTAILEIFSFLAMVNWIQCCTNFNLLNLMLILYFLPFHCSASFNFQPLLLLFQV